MSSYYDERLNFDAIHQLDTSAPNLKMALKNPALLGLTEDDLTGMTSEQREELIMGEYFAIVSRRAGELSSKLLMKSRWGYSAPEWYDHRNHLLDPETFFTDFWTMSADNAIQKMPVGSRVLDLCSGDGFYGYYFYRHRASEITCIELDASTHRQAMRLHHADNIHYINASALDYPLAPDYFDVILIRGAIEHFSETAQLELIRKARAALKIGGWFCGDTPANPSKENRMLNSHEAEWADEQEMRAVLETTFDVVNTSVLVSNARTTLFWQCMRTS